MIPARRVLIVEDNPDGREALCTLLQLLGYSVEVAKDGRQGIEKALSWHPEIAFVDIGLPIVDGYQVARHLRAQLGDSICLIAHTGYGQSEDRARAFEAGFDAHLVKPVEYTELYYVLNSPPSHRLSTSETSKAVASQGRS